MSVAFSKIAWCDGTFNPWIGCTKVSEGCRHCYAESEDKRRGWTSDGWGKGKPRVLTKTPWKELAKMNQRASQGEFRECACGWRAWVDDVWSRCPECGEATTIGRPRVFTASLSDWLDDEVEAYWRAQLLRAIRESSAIDFLLLTKRPQLWRQSLEHIIKHTGGLLAFHHWIEQWLNGQYPENVWAGTTVENQPRGKERIPKLLEIPAKYRFLSVEPMLGPLDLEFNEPCDHVRQSHEDVGCWKALSWVICGGESHPARGAAAEFHLEWAEDLRDQCAAAGVAFFMKQLGSNPWITYGKEKPVPYKTQHPKGENPEEWPEGLIVRQFPDKVAANS